MLIGQRIQLHQFVIGDHVARWVSRARYADHARLFANMQVFKIDVIFELAFRQQLDVRARRDEQILFQAGIGIADILRRQRKQHFFGGAVRATSCEQVKQVEKRALAAVCQCNILWFDIPAQLVTQHFGEECQQLGFPLRAVVIAKRIGCFAAFQHLSEQGLEIGIHLRDLSRVSAAEHDCARCAQPVVEVLHQASNA